MKELAISLIMFGAIVLCMSAIGVAAGQVKMRTALIVEFIVVVILLAMVKFVPL